MAHTHKPGYTLVTDAGTVIAVSQTFTANTDTSYDAALVTGTTNLPFNVTFDSDDLISCGISSDQAITLKVNSTGSPVPTINIAAGVPLLWNNLSNLLSPFTTTPVTVIYITNASGATANIKMYFLIDSD